MSELERPPDIELKTSSALPERRRNARVISMVMAAAFLLGAGLLALAGQTSIELELRRVAIVLGLVGLASLMSIWMVRRGRADSGAWLIIFSLLVAVPALSAFVSNLGLALGIAVVLIVPFIGALCLPVDRVRQATLLSLIAGASSIIIDFYSPLDRLVLSHAELVIPALDLVLAILLTVVIGRQYRTYSLRTKLIIAFLVVSLIPLALLAFLDNRATRIALIDQSNQKLYAASTQMAATLDAFIRSNVDDIRTEAQLTTLEVFLGQSPEERAGSELQARADEILNVLKRKDVRNITSYALLDLSGRNILDTKKELVGQDESDRDYFIQPLSTGWAYASHVQIPADTSVPSVYFSSPVRDQSGQLVGILRVRYRAKVFQEMLIQNTGLAGEESFAVLFDDQHIHLAHSTAPQTIMTVVGTLTPDTADELQSQYRLPRLPIPALSSNLPELEQSLSRMEEFPFFEAEDVATGNRVNQVAVTSMATQPWLVAFLQPQDVLFAPTELQTRSTLLLAFLITGGVALAAVSVSQLLTRPISRLTGIATRISEGDLTAQARDLSADEIGTLAEAFNTMTSRLRDLITGLEDRVSERTQDLERRAKQLQAAAEIAKDAAGIRDVDRLLDEAVSLISDRFGYYHAGVFLIDETGEYAVLKAASSEGGRRMLGAGHRLAVGKVGIVGYVTGTGRPRISVEVGEDSVHYANPDLPVTRSEMALPLTVGDKVIGALDVQSIHPSAFEEEDVVVLQTMADQLAIAIENTRLLTRQTNVAVQRRRVIDLYRNLTQQLSYDQLLAEIASRMLDTFRYARVTLCLVEGGELVVRSSAADPELSAADLGAKTPLGQGALGRAAATRSPVRIRIAPGEPPRDSDALLSQVENLLAVPLVSRGAVMGALAIEEFAAEEIDEDEIELLELLASQVAVSIENARLFEETERSLRQIDSLYRQQAAEAWSQLMSTRLADEREASYFSGRPRFGEPSLADEGAHTTPISLRGEVIGHLDVEGLDLEDWSEEEIAILEAVAQDVADHLEQVRLIQEVQRRATQIETAADIARAATGVLDLDTLLSQVVNLIRDRFNYYHVSIYLLDEESDELYLREGTGEVGAALKSSRHAVQRGPGSIPGQVAALGERYVAHEVSGDPHFLASPMLPETRSELGVPIKIGETIVGALDVQHSRPNAFSDEEIAVLEVLADQVAVAIQNAQLFQDTLQRAERERAVVEITGKIRASENIDAMLRTAVTEIRKKLGASRGQIRLVPTSFEPASGVDRPDGKDGNPPVDLDPNGRPGETDDEGAS